MKETSTCSIIGIHAKDVRESWIYILSWITMKTSLELITVLSRVNKRI